MICENPASSLMQRGRRLAAAVLAVCLCSGIATSAAGANATDMPMSLVPLLEKVIPSVVAIHTRRVVGHDGTGTAPHIERAEGSGFIVSADGFIATNKHVVSGAYDVSVVLHDGTTMQARIVWESPVVDVAFLKVESRRPLETARLAGEGTLAVGRRVVVVGNPMGLGISASAGIVSALDRNLSLSPYDNFIQTDAALNYGNSGGPLVDVESGDVVGMNSILWTAGKNEGSQGLGFAIPAADIAFLIDQLKRNGRIECGSLGLKAQKLTAAMAEALSFPEPYGVIVATVDSHSVAQAAGLRPGDIVSRFDGRTLYDTPTLNRAACRALGRTVPIEGWRDGRSFSVQADITKKDLREESATGAARAAAPRFASAKDLGVDLAPLDSRGRAAHHLAAGTPGIAVAAVAGSSEAAVSGLSAGDVIISLQKVPLTTTAAFDDVLAASGRTGRRNAIALVNSAGGDRWITLPIRTQGAP